MGSSNSKQLSVCHFCATEIPGPNDSQSESTSSSSRSASPRRSSVNAAQSTNSEPEQKSEASAATDASSACNGIELPANTFLCPRCHGFYRKPVESPQRRRFSSFMSSDSNGNHHGQHPSHQYSSSQPMLANADRPENGRVRSCRRFIEHLHIAPFLDSLDENEEKEHTADSIVETYLRPYFESEGKNLRIQSPNRLIINKVEFKVLGCYPPKGFVSRSTQFHLTDDDDRLIKLRWRPIRKIHLLPTKSSHETYRKQHRSDHSSESVRSSNHNEEHKNDDLLKSHLKPYLKKSDQSFYLRTDRRANNGPSIFEDEEEEKGSGFVVVPNQRPLHRHLMNDEVFVTNGDIEWRVMKCMPPDGFIDNTTQIFCHGEPVADLSTLSIRPIFESLPNAHKHYTPQQIKDSYLDPFFRGRCRFVDHLREMKIFGVDFSIRNSSPDAGIVTCQTVLDYNAAPVNSAELSEMQAQEDMELARQLQEEENNRSPFPSMTGSRFGANAQFHQVTLADITEIFERLQQVQGQQPQGPNNENQSDPFLQFMRQLQMATRSNQQRARNNGVNPQLIDRLPTMRYRETSSPKAAPVSTGNGDADEDEAVDIEHTCRICLEPYSDGEELRFLPCFHRYHKECVDRWFQMSSKCPICKTSITQSLRQ